MTLPLVFLFHAFPAFIAGNLEVIMKLIFVFCLTITSRFLMIFCRKNCSRGGAGLSVAPVACFSLARLAPVCLDVGNRFVPLNS